MNTPTPDYGEPWQESPTWNSVGTANGKFVLYEAFDMNEPYRSRAINCVNACAGMADPAKEIAAMRESLNQQGFKMAGFEAEVAGLRADNEEMREVLREAHTSLNLCSGIIGAPFDTEWKSVEECDAAYGSAKSTLAKLQPFIK